MENVSVIVPVYNAEKYLRACVESILAQTYKNISVILVDDGSTDSSGKICDEYAERHDNVRVIHKKNGGSVSARITGIEEACKMGGFTTFCDADDLMAPDAAEKLVSLAEENGADIACASLTKFFGKHFHVYLGKTPESKVRVYERDEILKEILPAYYGVCNFPGSMNTKLYSNEILKKSLNFECPVNFFQDDVTFNMQAMPLARRVAVTTDITYYYRVGGGTSRFMPEYLDDALNLYRFKLSRIDSDGLDRKLLHTVDWEMKNDLFCWLLMVFYRYSGGKNRQTVLNEIERCCSLPEIVQAVNRPKEDSTGIPGFRDLVRKKDTGGIYELLKAQSKKGRIKNIVRKIAAKL